MQKGQIVRRKLSSGEPIGSFCEILGFKGPNCSLVNLKSLDNVCTHYVKRERVYICKQVKVIISHYVYDRVERTIQSSIIHDSTPKWTNLYEKNPEIIQLRDELYPEKTMLFSVEDVYKIHYRGVPQIRLDLGYRIL